MRTKTTAISRRGFWLLSLLFFVSGGTGLAYQVIWFKRFSHVWGSTSLAFAAVGGSFLFGLGLGAYLFGRWSDRAKLPLRYYGLCEVAIGLLALGIPFAIAALVEASVGIYARLPEQPLLRFFVQFCITLVVIGPSCVLMGGTLPLLIRQLTARDGSLDQATGWLYAINTFGAAAGCYLAGFHLLPSLGLLWTNYATAFVNLAIGVVALWASRYATLCPPNTADNSTSKTRFVWTPAPVGLTLATVFSGCGALILEMTWARQLALILGGSTYAFTATLFVVLTGIALGSLLFHVWLKDRASTPSLPILVIGVLIGGILLGKLAIPQLSELLGDGDVQFKRGDQVWNGLICLFASGTVEFLASVAMGVLFPLFVHMTRASAAQVGTAVGDIYAWNTAGSILGASLTAVLLFPWIGTTGSLALAAGLYLAALLLILPWRPTDNLLIAVGATALILAIARPIDPRLTNLGLYMYGAPQQGEVDWVAAAKPLFFREGASSNVFVSQGASGQIDLRVNGKVDASDGGDMVTQLGLAYFPRFFKPDAKEVLVIGFGSGCTGGRCLLFPGTNVTCCEIEPAVYGASDQFAQVNFSPHTKTRAWLEARNAELPASERLTPQQIADEARFSIMFADGRTAIQGSGKKYDLIISEPSNPWLAGVSNLFTKEFFRAAREHLTDDGVLAQWIQTYNFAVTDYTMIVRTLRTEFPHFAMIKLMGESDTVLLASRKPLVPSAQSIASVQAIIDATPQIADDLQRWFGGKDARLILLQQYELDQEQLGKLVDADPSRELNTDLNLRLEFDAPLRLFRQLSAADAATVLTRSAGPQWRVRLAREMGLDPHSPQTHESLGRMLLNQVKNPLLRAPLIGTGQLDRAAEQFQKAIEIDPNLAAAHQGLAEVRRLQGESTR